VDVIDDRLMIDPPPDAMMAGAAYRIDKNTPSRLTEVTRRQSASDVSTIGCGVPIPALGTMMCSPPSSVTVWSTSDLT
jgi:hypothetical protein